MGASSARGGLEAITAAEELVRHRQRTATAAPLTVDQLLQRVPAAIDVLMGEGGIWAPQVAAMSLRQALGDGLEAARLLRAHRNTMPRLAISEPVATTSIEPLRRITPAYQTPPGPQFLGHTLDFMDRLLDTSDEGMAGPYEPVDTVDDSHAGGRNDSAPSLPEPFGRLTDLLRQQGWLVDRRTALAHDPEPYDVTRDPVDEGVPRSARLTMLARAETGALVGLWYQSVLGPDKRAHEVTLTEVRHGQLPVIVRHGTTGRPVTIGHVRVTEVEAVEDLDRPGEDTARFDVGYGLCLGHNERKAIAMANLDISIERERLDGGWLEHLALRTIDGLDSAGLLEHLKLPHYVSFRSKMDRKEAIRTQLEEALGREFAGAGKAVSQ